MEDRFIYELPQHQGHDLRLSSVLFRCHQLMRWWRLKSSLWVTVSSPVQASWQVRGSSVVTTMKDENGQIELGAVWNSQPVQRGRVVLERCGRSSDHHTETTQLCWALTLIDWVVDQIHQQGWHSQHSSPDKRTGLLTDRQMLLICRNELKQQDIIFDTWVFIDVSKSIQCQDHRRSLLYWHNSIFHVWL